MKGEVMKIRFLAVAAAMLFAAGCDELTALYSGLEERQANGVMAALMENGIPCHKQAGDEGKFALMIPESQFAVAMGILESRGLPRRQYQGVAESFRKTGMVSSPSEERIRFMDALAQDISRTISQIEGVVDARVHVVLPQNDPFAKNVKPSSAAVSIRHRHDVDMADFVPQIKSLVRNAIEGLDYGKITVTLFRDSPVRKR